MNLIDTAIGLNALLVMLFVLRQLPLLEYSAQALRSER